eukprot:889205_1
MRLKHKNISINRKWHTLARMSPRYKRTKLITSPLLWRLKSTHLDILYPIQWLQNVKQRLDSISGSNDSSSGDVWCHDLAYYKDITARYFDWDSIQTNVRSKRKKFVINPTFKKMVMELRERKRTDPKTYIKATREMEAIRKKVKSKRKQSNTESKRSRQRNDSDSDEPPAKRCRTNKNKTIARTNKKKTKSRKNKSKSMVDLSSGDDA